MVAETAPRCLLLPLLALPLALLARLPLSWMPPLARVLAALVWPLLRARRRIIATNLALCFPELDAAARRRLQRDNQRSMTQGLLELLIAWWRPDAMLRGVAEVRGIEHLEAALARGRGVLLYGGHMHCMELAARLLVLELRRPVHLMARPLARPCLQRLIDQRRRRFCQRTIDKQRPGELLRSLREGHPVGYAPDQNFSRSVAFVPFFGQTAATTTATTKIVQRSGCVLLPFRYWRSADGRRWQLRIDPPLDDFPGPNAQADAARLMALLEAQVREHPEQYLWAHRRFRTQPGRPVAIYDELRAKHRRGAKPGRVQ